MTDVRGFARHVAQHRAEDGGAHLHAAGIEARQARCLQRRGDRCVAGGGAGAAASRRAAPMNLPYPVRLIAVTGMRLSEAMGLERDDVDLEAGVLTVRLTKFGKSRLVPCIRRRACRARKLRPPARSHSDHAAARHPPSPSAVVDRCISTSTVSSGACPARSGCGALAIVPDRACTTSDIASPSGRCSAGIAEARR